MKLNLLKLTLLNLFIFLGNYIFAQNDIINTLKGEQIICTITKEDSVKVYFKIGGNVSSIEANILRTEIKSIEYAPKKQNTPELIANPESEKQQQDLVDYVGNDLPYNKPTAKYVTKNGISLSIGSALPIGKFAKETLDTNEIGPGKPGYLICLGFSHYAKKNIGFDMRAFYANNELNSTPIAEKYAYHTDSLWRPEKANWIAYGINIGFLLRKEFKYFTVFGRVSAGYATLKYPDLKLSVSSKNYIQFQSVNADAISIGLGGGLSYEILKGLDLILNMDYNHAKFKYNEILFIGETPNGLSTKKVSGTKRDVEQLYQNIYSTLGLCFWF